jgi:hypothetical protein
MSDQVEIQVWNDTGWRTVETGVPNDAGYYSRIMERVAASTGRRARVVDAQGRLLDLAG